jgi:saccharopine dehydrogenase-like NADP-dependent oxidoreductase
VQDHLRLLIVGGYGTFGGRIVELLESTPGLTLVIAGRSRERARSYCASRSGTRAMLEAAVFDRNGDAVTQLQSLRPDILIDASGPFQAYGETRYRLVEACLAEGVSYLDLADGSDFVDGVAQFDERARAAGIFVLSGASSFPVLTAAVMRRLSAGLARVDSIRGGIAPSPFAGVGENVIRAIAGYAGQPVCLVRDGASATGYPFTEQMRFTIAPPGRLPLRNTLFSLVDVPDLRALVKLWPGTKRIWMGAGPVPEILHHALIALSWLVRRRVTAGLSPLAPLMHFVTNRLRWGEHRGGMFVEVEGVAAAGGAAKRSWHLVAEGDDGPLIPSMAVQAIVRRVTGGRAPSPGARAAVQDLELDDYEKLFEGRQIVTGVRDEPGEAAPLYARVLSAAWDELPAEIRAMHDVHDMAVAGGRGSVERGSGLLARLAAALIGFPKAASDIDVSVRFDVAEGRETWTRSFGQHSFHSEQFVGTGRSERLLCERFGALTFAMALVVEQGRLHLVLRRWSAFGIPLPMFLCPRSTAFETAEDGRFRFHVEIGHPLTGLIVRYRGWLAPA